MYTVWSLFMVRNQLPAQVAKTNYLSVQGNSALSKDKAALLRDTGWLFPISPREEAGFVRLDAQQPAKRDVLTNLVIERGFYQSWVKRFSETSERKKKKKNRKNHSRRPTSKIDSFFFEYEPLCTSYRFIGGLSRAARRAYVSNKRANGR